MTLLKKDRLFVASILESARCLAELDLIPVAARQLAPILNVSSAQLIAILTHESHTRNFVGNILGCRNSLCVEAVRYFGQTYWFRSYHNLCFPSRWHHRREGMDQKTLEWLTGDFEEWVDSNLEELIEQSS